MPSADLLIPFFLASAVFACVPGPGMFYAAAQTLASGRQAGWWSALGFHIAGLGHLAAAAFGVAGALFLVVTNLLANAIPWFMKRVVDAVEAGTMEVVGGLALTLMGLAAGLAILLIQRYGGLESPLRAEVTGCCDSGCSASKFVSCR